jgi:hypothetical protein
VAGALFNAPFFVLTLTVTADPDPLTADPPTADH